MCLLQNFFQAKKICRVGKSFVILQKIKYKPDEEKDTIVCKCTGSSPAAEGRNVAKKICECQKLFEDDNQYAEYEACIEEWGEMIKAAYEKYENDTAKMQEFAKGGDSYKCE